MSNNEYIDLIPIIVERERAVLPEGFDSRERFARFTRAIVGK